MYDVLQFSVTSKLKKKSLRVVNNFAFQSDNLFSTTYVPRAIITHFSWTSFLQAVPLYCSAIQQLLEEYLKNLFIELFKF